MDSGSHSATYKKVFKIRDNHGEVEIDDFTIELVETIEGQDIFTSGLDPKAFMDRDNVESEQCLSEEGKKADDKDERQDSVSPVCGIFG